MRLSLKVCLTIIGLFSHAFLLRGQAPELIVPTRLGKPYNIMSIQDNKYLLVLGENSTQIWETATGRLVRTLKITAFNGMESLDGQTLYLSGRHMIYVVKTANLQLVDSMYVLGLRQFGVTPDSNRLYAYCANTKGEVVSLNLSREQRDSIFVFSTGYISDLKSFGVTKSGRYTLAQIDNSPAYLVENATKKIIKIFDNKKNLYILSPDDRVVEIAADNGQSTLSILNPDTYLPEITVSGPSKVVPYSIRKTLWLDNRRLLLYNSEQHAIVDFNKRTIGPDFKYYPSYHSIDHTCAARTENGSVRTVYISISHPENRLEEWDLVTRQKIRDVGDAIVSPFHNSLAPDGFRFQYGKDYEVVLGRTISFLKVNAQNEISAYTPDGKFRVHTGMMGILEKFKSLQQNAQLQASARINNSGSAVVIGNDGKVGAIINTGGIYLFDVQTMSLLREVSINSSNFHTTEQKPGIFIDNDRKIIASGIASDGKPQTYCVEVATGKILWTLKGEHVSFQETSEGIYCFDKEELNIKILNPLDGKVVNTHYLWNAPLSKLEVLRAAISSDGSRAILASSYKISFWNKKTRKVTIPKNNPLTDYVHTVDYFRHNPRYALSISMDGRVVLWDTDEATALATLFLFPNTKDWVCIAPDGRFDASQAAMRKMYYLKGMDVIPLERLYERYFTPGLLSQLLGGVDQPPINPDEDINKLKRPPVVKIQYQDKQRNLVVEDDKVDVPTIQVSQSPVTLSIEAYAPDDVIDDIRLYHNGKLIAGSTRGLLVDDDKQQRETRTFSLELLPGENRFRAVALNSQRTESAPAELVLQYKPTTSAPSVSSDITLHALVVGINKYKNPKYNLNYAVADASAFMEQLQQGGEGIFKKVQTVFITDENATLSGLLQALDNIKGIAQPNDVFVFYYAGHGVLDGKNQYYLVPHDVTQLYGNDKALADKGMSALLLQQYAQDLKAQKQLFILDACQSGGALEVAMRGAAEEKAISQLARSTGTHWLTASGSEQFASEFAQLGHGTFTFALLEALRGRADNGDRRITVKEIDAYLQSTVPELNLKYKGTPQYPASYGYGNDFPLCVVK